MIALKALPVGYKPGYVIQGVSRELIVTLCQTIKDHGFLGKVQPIMKSALFPHVGDLAAKGWLVSD